MITYEEILERIPELTREEYDALVIRANAMKAPKREPIPLEIDESIPLEEVFVKINKMETAMEG